MKDTELGKVKFDLKLAEAKTKGFDDKFKIYKEKADILDKLSDVLTEKEIESLNDRIIASESNKSFRSISLAKKLLNSLYRFSIVSLLCITYFLGSLQHPRHHFNTTL